MSRGAGYRVFTRIPRPDKSRYEPLLKAEAGQVCDALNRWGAMHGVRPVFRGARVLGPAVTVRPRACDNLLVYKAIELAQPGDVLVIATDGYTDAAVCGYLMALICKERGLGGLVTDGAGRDTADITNMGFPVFTGGTIPNSPFKDGPGEVNVPVSCGGIPVKPGDIIFGDDDGVVVIPQDVLDETVQKALAIVAEEEAKKQSILRGEHFPGWLDQRLAEGGCRIFDRCWYEDA